jgi:ABC-type Zn uptake system ZnuABC Zn-binding protein ZnuA
VIGEAIPALSTQAQPSAGDTAALVDQVEAEGVKAVFPEAGLNPRLQQAIADEANVTVGGWLWADTIGPPGSAAATYAGAMRANTDAIATGLSGGRVRCRPEA